MDEREERIRRLLPIVRALAKRISRLVPSVEMDDLIGEGSIGLIRAVDCFDPHYGTTLEHYARRLILGKMLNGIRRMDPVSERARREVRDAERQRYELAAERGEVPSLVEMLELRPQLAAALRQAREAVPLSLDSPLPENVNPPVDRESDPAAIAEERMQGAAVRSWLRRLSARHRYIIAQHYFAERPLRTVGLELGVSSQRASQLHRAAVAHLRSVARAAAD